MFQDQPPAAAEPLPEATEPQQQSVQPPADTGRQMDNDRLRELGPDVEIETLPDLDVIVFSRSLPAAAHLGCTPA